MRHGTSLDTPIGRLVLRADGEGLAAIDLPGTDEPWAPADTAVLREAARQLAAFFAGRLTRFALPLAPHGTEFQRRVWEVVAEIPFGETRSYRDVAVAIGQPAAVRAVGAANGKNPLPIVVPCHRVIGSSGRLVGYAGGLATKSWLLEHESGGLFAKRASGG